MWVKKNSGHQVKPLVMKLSIRWISVVRISPEGGCMQVDINIVTIKKVSNQIVHTLKIHIAKSG